MSDYLDALLDQVNRLSEEKPDDLDAWFDDVVEGFMLARAVSDTRTWLDSATGANAGQIKGEMERMHEAVIRCLNGLGQRAFMLWGVRIKAMTVPTKR